jgi:hypothetical protein
LPDYGIEPRTRELSREPLDVRIEFGEMDLAAAYATPAPMRVIAT